MPRYDYECVDGQCGNIKEVICKINERPDVEHSGKCGCMMGRIITGTQIRRDEPTWLDSAVAVAFGTDTENRRPETRTEHERYLKKMGYAHLE